MVLDKVHKYKNWSVEIKNSYDFFPDLKIIFTGSSIVDISRQQGDLRRRALMYDVGTMQETFVLSQLLAHHRVHAPKHGDFIVDNKYTFEVGGKGKDDKQIRGIENAWLVKDHLEIPVGNALPLWMLGLLH